MKEAIAYKITLDKLTQHLLTVECTVQRPNEGGQIVSLPNWIPGSYMIRDLAKNIVTISAQANDKDVPLEKITKNKWRCAPCTGPLQITYQVYCFDIAARGAYVDHTRAFFDGCRVFLVVEGEEEQTRSVEIVRSSYAREHSWRCATSMTRKKVDADGFGVYLANNHLDLIDHPFEISDFQSFDFMVADVPHTLVVTGPAQADFALLVEDVRKACQAQVDFFGELPVMDRYVFILSVLSKGWGGIEHRASSSLICARANLPRINAEYKTEEYRALLGLFSHEYFHLWNVKRIKPEVFLNPNLNAEVYTRQLWIFEGITAYFDNLNLVRADLLSLEEYLKILQDDINLLQQNPGARVQTLEDSSFDAWIKFYQPDENSINSATSYYLKGAMVALLLDLRIIQDTKRKQSLADVMQVLWQQYGKPGLGLPEDYFERITYEVTGEDYSDFFAMSLRTTESLEFADLLHAVGINYKTKNQDPLDNIGLKTVQDQGKTFVRSVLNDSAAEIAGLAPNDILLAVNNFAVVGSNLAGLIEAYPADTNLTLHVLRNDYLLELNLLNPPLAKTSCVLELAATLTEKQKHARERWLGVSLG